MMSAFFSRLRRGSGRAAGLFAGLLGVVVLIPVATADEVVLIQGSTVKQAIGGRVRGQIQSETPSEVVVKLGANTTSVPVDQIVSIRYDGQPATIQLAETRENGGQLAEAAELYKKAATEAADKPLVVQAALAREAACLAELAFTDPDRTKDALDRLQRFAQTYPASRHALGIQEDLARLQLNAGDFKAAEATVAAIRKLPNADSRAAVLNAKLLSKQEKYDEAVSELDRLIGTLPDNSVAQRDAKLVKAVSLAGQKKFKEAETLLEEVIQTTSPEDAAAQSAAYNTLGDCLRAANRPKDALLAYLHTDLLYAKDKQEHPRALYQIEKLFRQIKQDGRADDYAKRLRQEYPKSRWLNVK